MASVTQTMDAPLERLVRHVVEAMHPLEIWLFGSRAEDRARPTSDYDLLGRIPADPPADVLQRDTTSLRDLIAKVREQLLGPTANR